MIIISIELKNFLGTRKISDKDGIVKIDFPKDKNNIILIKGENGLGKSTLLENLTPYSSMLKRDLKLCISYPAHKKIVIEKNGVIYHLETYFEDEKTKKGYIYTEIDGVKTLLEDTSKGNITEFDYQIEKIFGNFEKFKNSSFLKQGATDIVEAKPTERLEVINKFMPSLDIYEKGKNFTHEKATNIKSEIERLIIKKNNIEEFAFKYERIKEKEKDFNDEKILEYKNKKNILELNKNEYVKVMDEKKFLNDAINKKEEDNSKIVILDNLENDLLELENKIVEIDEKSLWELTNLNNIIKDISFNIQNNNDNIVLTDNETLLELENEINNLLEIEKEFIKESEFIKNKELELFELKNQISSITILTELEKNKDIFIDNIKQNKANLKNINIEDRKKFLNTINNNISILKTLKLKQFEISMEENTKSEEETKIELKKLLTIKEENLKNITRKNELEININDLNKEMAKYLNIEDKIKDIDLKKIDLDKKIKNIDIPRLENFIEDMKKFSQTIKNIENRKFDIDLNDIDKKIVDNNEKILNLKKDLNKFNLNKGLISSLNEKIEKELSQIKDIDFIEEDIDLLEKNLEVLNKKIYKLEDLEHNINNLEKECLCPTCNKEITKEELNDLKKDLSTLQFLIKDKDLLIQKIKNQKESKIIFDNNVRIRQNIKEMEDEIKLLKVDNIDIDLIEKMEKENNNLINNKKDYEIINKEIEVLKNYNELISDFNFKDLDKLYENYKVIFYDTKELLNNEKVNIELRNELTNQKNILFKDLEYKNVIEGNINKTQELLRSINIINFNDDSIKNLENILEEIRVYKNELTIFNNVVHSIKNELPDFGFDFKDNNKNIYNLEKIKEEKSIELYVEEENINNIKELEKKVDLLEKDILANNKNILLKKDLENKIDAINIILSKERIKFDFEKLNSLKDTFEMLKNKNKFIINIIEKLNVLKDFDIKKFSTFVELKSFIDDIFNKNNDEINKVELIKNNNLIIKQDIDELKNKIKINLINKTTFNNNINDIKDYKDKIANLKSVEFDEEEYEKFIVEFDEFNEELKKFLIDKTDIEIKFNEYKQIEEEIKKLEEDEWIWKKLKSYSLKIKKSIISETFAEITDLANEILENEGTISLKLAINQINDRKFEIKAIDTKDGVSVSDISLLSGAEAMAVTKAISFSLSKKTEHKVLWLDESDGVLSKKNKNLFVDMLKKLWENFELDEIFVISHQEEVEKMVDVVVDLNKLINKN